MAEQKETNISAEKKGGKKTAVKVCIAVIAIAVIAVVLYFLFRKEPERRNVVVNEDNVDQVLEQAEEYIPAGYYEVTMNSTWNFASGDAPSDNAYVKNADTNTNAVYFDVIRTDTEETIFKSPILPVGTYLDNITLDSELPSGTYDCLVTYHLLDENEESISTVDLTLTIVVGQ